MDRRSSLARAAAQGLLSGLGLVACSPTQTSTTAPVAPMDPVATSAPSGSSRVAPSPPPLRPGTLGVATSRDVRDRACCRGLNDCKGKGGCANDAHDCAGKNECKGTSTACPPEQSSFNTPSGLAGAPKDCCKGKNECKGKTACKVPGHHECRGRNECKGKGLACLPLKP
jgi:hypothetical protein